MLLQIVCFGYGFWPTVGISDLEVESEFSPTEIGGKRPWVTGSMFWNRGR